MNFNYEIKKSLDSNNGTYIWTESEIFDFDKDHNAFIVKYSNTRQEELQNISIIVEGKINYLDNNTYVENSIVEFYTKIDDNIEGWLNSTIKQIKGNFYLLEYEIDGVRHNKILTKQHIRHRSVDDLIVNLDLNNEFFVTHKLDFLNKVNRKENKIVHLIKNIQNLVDVKFVYYSRNKNDLIIFLNQNSQEETELIEQLLDTAKDHYNEVCSSKSLSPSESSNITAEKVSRDTKKKRIKTDEKEYPFHSSIKLEKFIFDLLKPTIENFKKNPSIKIEYKNTKDPNTLKLEIKGDNQAIFDQVNNELNIVQKYLTINLNEKDSFITSDNLKPFTLKYILKLYNINSFRIFKLDEESVSIQLIGKASCINLVSCLIEEVVKSELLIRKNTTF